MTRSARRRKQTRRDLLAAARTLFATKGYQQTKVSDISDAADVGVGTFYLHYDGKEALFLELVEETTRQLKEAVDTAKAAVTDALDQARVSFRVLFRFAEENRETFRILFGEGSFNQAIKKAQSVFITDIAENIRTGTREGKFASYPPSLVVHGVIGFLTQVVSWWITQEDVSLEDAVEATNRFVASGLLPHESAA